MESDIILLYHSLSRLLMVFTGVDFPGIHLDSWLDKPISKLDRFSFFTDLIVVEIKANDSPFIFKYNKNPGEYGKCEGCYQISLLKITCACKEV